MTNKKVKIIECPRDAMQGIIDFIPTKNKARYINTLLKVGYHTIDFGSFVSPKAIPQMRDTAEVLKLLDLEVSDSKLLAISANYRGAEDACSFDEISYVGFPFSVSETFQQRNTHKSIEQSFHSVEKIQSLIDKSGKELVVYLSMAFGNPYGDEWDLDIVSKWAEKIAGLGVKTIALSDTIGVSEKDSIHYLFSNLIADFPQVEFGAHLHSRKETWREKVMASYDAGCRRFDSAIKGLGGCPMAKDDLVGNLPTEKLLSYMTEKRVDSNMNPLMFESAYNAAIRIFND
ncbi:MAG: hydroxymethylglutaryl-CoA lyase [Flavobacteriales bacterium]|nr:hydroxymethylglutaryl-CoA lyase [Flavobacteriales bacterium]